MAVDEHREQFKMGRGGAFKHSTFSRPCVVKNTFLHMLLPADDDVCVGELPGSESNRSESSPAMFDQGELSQLFQEIQAERQAGSICKDFNEVDLSMGRDVSAATTSAGSIPQVSSDDPGSDEAVGSRDCTDQDDDPPAQARRRGSCTDVITWEDGVTTVMVRQVPRQYTQWMLWAEVSNGGFEGLFDFIYLPFDFKKNTNVGYGFLSFTEPEYARQFRDAFDGKFLANIEMHQGKPVRVHPATVQGYEANLRHFARTKTGMQQHPHFSPLFLPRPSHGAQPRRSDDALAPTPYGGWVTVDGFVVQMPQRQEPHAEAPVLRRFCHSCGIPHSVEQNFCANCGVRLEHKGFSDQ